MHVHLTFTCTKHKTKRDAQALTTPVAGAGNTVILLAAPWVALPHGRQGLGREAYLALNGGRFNFQGVVPGYPRK